MKITLNYLLALSVVVAGCAQDTPSSSFENASLDLDGTASRLANAEGRTEVVVRCKGEQFYLTKCQQIPNAIRVVRFREIDTSSPKCENGANIRLYGFSLFARKGCDSMVTVEYADRDWQNKKLAEDVNNDGAVTEADATAVTNELNRRAEAQLSKVLGFRPYPSKAPKYDVNGDGWISPTDVLLVINKINEIAREKADAEAALKSSEWTNTRVLVGEYGRYDVNNDGLISPLDRLVIINAVNGGMTGPLGARQKDSTAPYYDVNGDGFLSPLDYLMMINYLNGR